MYVIKSIFYRCWTNWQFYLQSIPLLLHNLFISNCFTYSKLIFFSRWQKSHHLRVWEIQINQDLLSQLFTKITVHRVLWCKVSHIYSRVALNIVLCIQGSLEPAKNSVHCTLDFFVGTAAWLSLSHYLYRDS